MSKAQACPRVTATAALLAVLLCLTPLWLGCNGTAGTTAYDDPVGTTATGPIIDAATLVRWADEGRVNAPLGTADRVVIVSVTSRANFTSAVKRHIPDALFMDSSTELYATREEGLGPVGSDMPSGPQIDAVVQRLGIDDHTTIVLTIPRGSTDSEHYSQSRAYFTFRYWGFPKERLKILNGGDDAWEVAGQPLTDAIVVVTPSAWSVRGNKALKDGLRYSVGEMMARVDQINADPSQLAEWQMIEPRGYTTTPYLTNALRGSGGWQFAADRVNGETTRNHLYPDAATLAARFASLPVKDGTTDRFLSTDKKTVVMCGGGVTASATFVLFDAVLGVPEGNVAIYDGSSSQWQNYSVAKIRAAGATATQANTWAFDVVSPGTSVLRSPSVLPSPVTGENIFIPGNFMYTPAQLEMSQEESADRAYMSSGSGSGTNTGTPGASSASGC